MAEPIGGNKLIGSGITYSVTPNATYAGGVVYYLDDSLSDYSTVGKDAINGQFYDIELFYTAYTGWTSSPVAATIDAGAAVSGDLFSVQGIFNNGDGIVRPTSAHLEHSDNGSSWTTLENRTGLTASPAGRSGWLQLFTITGESHQYWRVSFAFAATFLFISDIRIT